jgi:PKD repeat protein
LNLALTNASKDGDTYSWNFGNGTTSNLKDPIATFNEGGNYQVTLTVTGKGGTATYSQTVIVKNKYTSVGVTELVVLAFPALKPDGSNWDGNLQGSFPDVYFQVADPSNTTILIPGNPDSRQENLNPAQLPLTWSGPNGEDIIVIEGITGSYNLQLLDYDSIGSDELIGFVNFNLNNYTTLTNKYPTEVTSTNGQTSVRLKLNWQE